MIYIVAIVFSLIACAQSAFSEITASNIAHLRNGRPANAGFSIFPSVPVVQFIYVGVAWALRAFYPEKALSMLVVGFFVISLAWAVLFAKLWVEFRRVRATCSSTEHDVR